MDYWYRDNIDWKHNNIWLHCYALFLGWTFNVVQFLNQILCVFWFFQSERFFLWVKRLDKNLKMFIFVTRKKLFNIHATYDSIVRFYNHEINKTEKCVASHENREILSSCMKETTAYHMWSVNEFIPSVKIKGMCTRIEKKKKNLYWKCHKRKWKNQDKKE